MAETRHLLNRVMLCMALSLLLYVLVLCAWQGDDAYITFRTVRNAVAGEGLTWNPGERVQAYSHPAWMFLACLVYLVTHELFVSMTVVALVLTLVAAGGMVALCRSQIGWATALLAVWASSRALVDHAVSGLENPLVYVVLLVTVLIARDGERSGHERSTRRFRAPGLRDSALCASFACVFLTRPDAVLLVAPVVCMSLLRQRIHPLSMLWGLAPALFWELFSLLYYGSWVPNTAIAKLNVVAPRSLLLAHGWQYLVDSLYSDPITLAAISVVSLLLSLRGNILSRSLVGGAWLYLAYVIWIGGDFMSGRFLAAPMVLCSFAAANHWGAAKHASRPPSWIPAACGLACMALYSAVWDKVPLRSSIDYGVGAVTDFDGVVDERAYYYPETGFLRVLLMRPELVEAGLPVPPAHNALVLAHTNESTLYNTQVGYLGYFGGDRVIVDPLGLTDPLLARIPYVTTKRFRPGHLARKLPAGYWESRVARGNLLVDPALHRAYGAIRLVTTGALLSPERVLEIWRLSTGVYSDAFSKAASRGVE